MVLPKKLNPDNLKDTLVEIRYAQGIPPELMSGFVSSILVPLGYKYLSPPPQNINIALDNNQQITLGLESNGSGFFIKDVVRIQFVANRIIFNCLADKYTRWEKYFQTISDIISALFDNGAIKDFNGVSIRYVSEFRNTDIYQGLKGTIDFSEAGLKSDNSFLRLVDESGDLKTYVALTNKAKRMSPSSQGQEIIEASLVDINVYENFSPIPDLDTLKNKLNQIHAKQKEVFFSLINDAFLKKLNPEY